MPAKEDENARAARDYHAGFFGEKGTSLAAQSGYATYLRMEENRHRAEERSRGLREHAASGGAARETSALIVLGLAGYGAYRLHGVVAAHPTLPVGPEAAAAAGFVVILGLCLLWRRVWPALAPFVLPPAIVGICVLGFGAFYGAGWAAAMAIACALAMARSLPPAAIPAEKLPGGEVALDWIGSLATGVFWALLVLLLASDLGLLPQGDLASNARLAVAGALGAALLLRLFRLGGLGSPAR